MLYLQYNIIGNDTFCNIYRKNNLHKRFITHTLPTMLKRRKLSIIKLTNFGFYH